MTDRISGLRIYRMRILATIPDIELAVVARCNHSMWPGRYTEYALNIRPEFIVSVHRAVNSDGPPLSRRIDADDPLEKGKASLQYSGLENSMDCSPWGCKESDTTE